MEVTEPAVFFILEGKELRSTLMVLYFAEDSGSQLQSFDVVSRCVSSQVLHSLYGRGNREILFIRKAILSVTQTVCRASILCIRQGFGFGQRFKDSPVFNMRLLVSVELKSQWAVCMHAGRHRIDFTNAFERDIRSAVFFLKRQKLV